MMNLTTFADQSALLNHKEIEKVKLLAFYHLEVDDKVEFDTKDVLSWFARLHLAAPNESRLRNNLRDSRKFVRGSRADTFRLHRTVVQELSTKYPDIRTRSEAVVSADTILPEKVFTNTRGYIESLARQINASYEDNIFDGCAVLMRRLVEILLIHSYEHLGIEHLIKGADGNYVPLERIVADAAKNSTLNLSRNSKTHIETFRTLGNFAAHKIFYNTAKADIEKVIIEYRAMIEELLYKAGIRK